MSNSISIMTDISEIIKKEFSSTKDGETFLKNWALALGFELVKSTSSKDYAIYLKCHCSGKVRRNPLSEGKRVRGSKKTGNYNRVHFFIY